MRIIFSFNLLYQLQLNLPYINTDCQSFNFGEATAHPSASGPGPPHSRGLYITYNDASQSVALLWTSDQPVAETSNFTTHNTHNRQTSMFPGGIRTHNPSKRAAADPRLRPRGYWDRHGQFSYAKLNLIAEVQRRTEKQPQDASHCGYPVGQEP